MIRPSRTLAALGVALALASCASSGSYLKARGRDAADVVTLAVGYGVGASVRVSAYPITAGMLWDAWGLQGGAVGRLRGRSGGLWPLGVDDEAIPTTDRKGKHGHVTVWLPEYDLPKIDSWWVVGDSVFEKTGLSYLTDINLAAGLGPALRVGFNPGEFLDFVLGWFGVDLFHDDPPVDGQPPAPPVDSAPRGG